MGMFSKAKEAASKVADQARAAAGQAAAQVEAAATSGAEGATQAALAAGQTAGAAAATAAAGAEGVTQAAATAAAGATEGVTQAAATVAAGATAGVTEAARITNQAATEVARSGAEGVTQAALTAGQSVGQAAATAAAGATAGAAEAARLTNQAATEAARTGSAAGRAAAETGEAATELVLGRKRRTPPSSRPSNRASSRGRSRPASRASSTEQAIVAAPATALVDTGGMLFPPGEKPSLLGYERLVRTKQTEIDLVMTENEQLRLAMDRLERELGTLAEALQAKDRQLRQAQVTIDDRDHEIRQLSVVRSQAEGKDEAMKIASRQNREILRILQEANLKATTLAEENARMKAELQREYVFGERRMRRSTQQNERLRNALHGAQQEITVNVLAKLSASELSKAAVLEQDAMRLKTDAEMEAHHDELNERRQRQYVLTSQLIDAKDEAYRVSDRFEALVEKQTDESERAEELEARLQNAVLDLEETETALGQTQMAHAADAAARATAVNQNNATNLRSEALAAALQSAVDERRRVREWHARAKDEAAAATVVAAAAEAAAKRSLARHVDTLTDVRKHKTEKRALQGQLDRTRLLLGRTRHKLTATLHHPPGVHKPGVRKERRRRRTDDRSVRSAATAPSRHLMGNSVASVHSAFPPPACALAPAPA